MLLLVNPSTSNTHHLQSSLTFPGNIKEIRVIDMKVGEFVVGGTKLVHNINSDEVRSIEIIFEKNTAKVLFGYKEGTYARPHYDLLDMGGAVCIGTPHLLLDKNVTSSQITE